MSFEDDLIAKLAAALVVALGTPGNPVLKELQAIAATNEARLATQMQQAFNTAVAQGLSTMVADPAFKQVLISAIKGALPFPFT
jgi:membrane-bound lytic murein transglycosylase B